MIQKKTTLLSVSALLVLLAFTIVLTALALNTVNLRSSFAEYITQQTKRNVTIGGDSSEERRVGKECRARWSP